MGFQWTPEQEKVITLRDRNLLVSAAAGSGKTAVLVERICRRVMDREHPCNIDELLVVTFTKAAAAEMRGRIAESLERRLEAEPDNTHLQKQVVLSRNAQITTIDGFCLNLLKEHFYLLDMEPGFQVMDENEKKLLMEDVFNQVVNEYYKQRTPEFISFVENYCTGKKDEELAQFVFSMYQNATSHPWPKKWLRECVEGYQDEGIEEHPLICAVLQETKQILQNLVDELAEMNGEVATIPELEKLYLDLTKIKEDILELKKKETFADLGKGIRDFTFVNMPRISSKDEAVLEVKEAAKEIRERTKKQIQGLAAGYFSTKAENLGLEGKRIYPMIKVLCDLTENFMDAFDVAKRKKNRVDFNDVEHLALSILIDEVGTETTFAEEYKKQYKEIMIDEYQDSNLLQEYILTAISTCSEGKNNLFMVGDVKQSIYRFRLARPDMFVEKYNRYTLQDSQEQKILLDANFRSRAQVLEFANDVFGSLMQADLGDIAYDEAATLKVGAQYLKEEEERFRAEVLLVDGESFEDTEYTKEKAESLAIAARILKEVREGIVTDKVTGELRPTRYEDIVVLSRSTVWWDTLKEVLSGQGIPAIITGNTGYFDSIEIITILAFLQVVDNRMQDIPLVTVLTSSIGGLDKEALAIIKNKYPSEKFCKACVLFSQDDGNVKNKDEEQIKTKLNKLFRLVDDFKRRAGYEPVYELLEEIYEETGFYYQMGVLSQGNVRMQNLDMLIEKAYNFENSSYHGLYHFLRYISKIRKYEIDFPISGDNMDLNAVRIMTIHKSKGLEFPVVIVSALSRQFNTSDTKARLITHPEYGAAMEIADGIRRTRRQGFFKQAMKGMVHKENLAEEIRVLYVALTRAKEKLILTGTVKNKESVEEIFKNYEKKTRTLSYTDKLRGRSYLDWILKILASLRKKYDIQITDYQKLNLELTIQTLNKVDNEPWFLIKENELFKDQKEKPDGEDECAKKEIIDDIQQQFSFVYSYEDARKVPLKMSVSDIKHHVMEEIFLAEENKVEEIVPEFLVEEKEKRIPVFLKGEITPEENPGALRGTAFHRVMECIRFEEDKWIELGKRDTRKDLDEEIRSELDRQLSEGLITPEIANLIYIGKISNFILSPLFAELHEAAKVGTLKKEQPFVMGISPAEAGIELPQQMKEQPTVLVQGIIDVFYEKDGKITLLDYKTDKVKTGEELILRYKKQMELYKDAICRATGKEVDRIVLYSFSLEETIDVKL